MTFTKFNSSEKLHNIEILFENIWKIGDLEISEFLNYKIFPKLFLTGYDDNKKIINNLEIFYFMKQSFKILKEIMNLDIFFKLFNIFKPLIQEYKNSFNSRISECIWE